MLDKPRWQLPYVCDRLHLILQILGFRVSDLLMWAGCPFLKCCARNCNIGRFSRDASRHIVLREPQYLHWNCTACFVQPWMPNCREMQHTAGSEKACLCAVLRCRSRRARRIQACTKVSCAHRFTIFVRYFSFHLS